MKFQCMGYFNQEKMDALPQKEIDAIMQECEHHLKAFYENEHVLTDAAVSQKGIKIQRINDAIQVDNVALSESKRMIGSSFMIEAKDMEEAIHIASQHPTVIVTQGEQLGWEIEVRAIEDYYERK